MALEKLDQLSY